MMRVRLVAFERDEERGRRIVHDIREVEAFTPKGRLTTAFQKHIADLLEDETWVGDIELTRIKAE